MALKPPPAPRGSAAPRLPAPPQPPPSWTAPRSGAAHSGLAGLFQMCPVCTHRPSSSRIIRKQMQLQRPWPAEPSPGPRAACLWLNLSAARADSPSLNPCRAAGITGSPVTFLASLPLLQVLLTCLSPRRLILGPLLFSIYASLSFGLEYHIQVPAWLQLLLTHLPRFSPPPCPEGAHATWTGCMGRTGLSEDSSSQASSLLAEALHAIE